MPGARTARLQGLRAQIAALEAGTRTLTPVLPFGDARVDGCLTGGGLALGRWHELGGEGAEIETAACAAAFVAALTRPLAAKGEIVWVLRRDDLFAPGLAGLGLPPEKLIGVCARDEAEALAAIEDALGTVGVAAVVGEVEAVSLVAGRRLQLACERHGATGLLIRRRPFGGAQKGSASGSASATRWKIGPAPSEPGPDEPWLGPPRWRVELERSRGGRPGGWVMELNEAPDGPHPFRVVSDLADRGLAAEEPQRLRA
ncbi:MAG TPA: protein imuA [Caulobacteraceae bacterium]|nr:protein imuA [Caulobacteraceae bacterium]